MLLGGRGPTAGRPCLDLVGVKIKMPRAWVERIGRGKLQRFVRNAVERQLNGE